ncbi:hypothetical protein SAMN04488012_10149 [Palleronia salina]|uniref:Uncharacterized protein n=1 Tax=Palleronia salina TaxID=313368 RepID=A0A1M6AA46_9RHOB|nr:hypothetical protein SAMN04488012_10149 [Palleronia salina]
MFLPGAVTRPRCRSESSDDMLSLLLPPCWTGRAFQPGLFLCAWACGPLPLELRCPPDMPPWDDRSPVDATPVQVTISTRKLRRDAILWDAILEPDETMVWSGRPDYGRKLHQAIGDERVLHGSIAVGIAVIWAVLPLLPEGGHVGQRAAIGICAVSTLLMLLFALAVAVGRTDHLGRVHYAVTDCRAIVCHDVKTLTLTRRARLICCALSQTFTYPISDTRPHASVRVGSEFARHPTRYSGVEPILFEQVADAEHVRSVLFAASEASARRGG